MSFRLLDSMSGANRARNRYAQALAGEEIPFGCAISLPARLWREKRNLVFMKKGSLHPRRYVEGLG